MKDQEFISSRSRRGDEYELTTNPTAITDANRQFIFVNDGFLESVGRSRNELLSLRVDDIIRPEGKALDEALARVGGGNGQTSFDFEARITKADGSGVDLRIIIWPLHRNGKLDGFVLISPNLAANHARERLRASEQKFRAAIDAVQGILWTNNAAGEMVGEQPGWAALTGQGYDDYQGYGWAKAVHPDDAEPTIKAWKQAVENRTTFIFEHRVRRHDEQWRTFLIRAIPILDEEREIREWVGVHTDMTEQRTNERILRDLTGTLEDRVEAAIAERDRTWKYTRDLIAVADKNGTLRAANPAWTTILGWKPEEVVGRRNLDFIHKDDHGLAEGALVSTGARALDGFEVRMKHKNGTYRWISWVAAPENALIYANGRDITAEKEAAVAFERSESRFRAIFQTSYQYKAIAALNGSLLDANPTSLRGIGATLSDLVGKPVWDTPWFTGTPGISEKMRKGFEAAAKGRTIREELVLNLPSGIRYFDYTSRPIEDAQGEVMAVVFEGADITARRQAEEALRQSQKLEAIGQLTGGLAHDLNNLLTPIVGSFDILQRKCHEDPQALRLISAALRSADRARLLVQRLLAFARRQHLEARTVELDHLVHGMLDLIRRSLGSRFNVRVEIADDLPPARVDPNQLEMALLNLTVNSRDAMPNGGTILISAKAVDVCNGGDGSSIAPGRYVCLSVTDGGVGMHPETLARAIEPFFTTKAIGKGTGLGLSMVHGLAAQSGGQLTLESVAGQGTTATLWLPAVMRPNGKSPAPSPDDNSLSAGSLLILLVDDDDLVRAGTAAMLQAMGHIVVEASSGERALQQLTSGTAFDLLLTDQRMPSMSGDEIIQRGRLLQPGLPAVLITGYTETVGHTANAVLPKPFRIDDLTRAVTEALRVHEPIDA